jgi:hypothetical protein
MSLKISFFKMRSVKTEEDFLVGVVTKLKVGVVEVVDCFETIF